MGSFPLAIYFRVYSYLSAEVQMRGGELRVFTSNASCLDDIRTPT